MIKGGTKSKKLKFNPNRAHAGRSCEDAPDCFDSDKPTVIWDLDNTLLSAEPSDEFPFFDPEVQKRLAPLGRPYDMDGIYVIYERPGLQKFLDWVFKYFNVCVWTAATKDYCTFICREILIPKGKKNRQIPWTFFSYHRKRSSKRFGKGHPKDLRLLWDVYQIPGLTPRNCFIVDDHKQVKLCQPDNAVVAPEWECLDKGAADDKYFVKLKKGMEAYLKKWLAEGGVDCPGRVIEACF